MRFHVENGRSLPRMGWLVLLVALVFAAAEVPDRLKALESDLEVLRLWPDRVAQTHKVVGTDLYKAFTAANRFLPRDATILLVTAGEDVRHWEYTTFHRTLYYLAPRPVWWVAPVEQDGTWESRWWTPTVLSVKALEEHAAAFGATYVLSFGVPPAAVPGEWILDLPAQGNLSALPGALPLVSDGVDFPEIDGVWLIRLIAAVSVTLLAGHLVIECIAPPDLHGLGIQRLSLDWLLGAGVVSLGLYWLGNLSIPLTVQAGILTGLVLAGTLILRPWRSIRIQRAGFSSSRGKHWLIGGLLAWVFAEFGFVSIQAVFQPLNVWDSWVTWGMRARLIYLEGGITPLLYSEPSRLVTRLSYPLLVPLMEVWNYVWLGTPDDRFAGAQAVLYLVALSALIFTAVRSYTSSYPASESYALVVVLGLISIPYIGGLAGVVFADVPLAAYTTAAALFLRRWLVHGSAHNLTMAAIFAGLMPWTKPEGFILLAALGVAALLVTRAGRRAWVACLEMGIAAGIVAGPWYARVATVGTSEPAYQTFTWATFVANINRLPRIVPLFGARALGLDWHFLWIAIALVGIYVVLARPVIRPLFPVTIAVYLSAIILTFVFSDYEPLEAHILSSADRLMAHVAPLATLWLAELPFILGRSFGPYTLRGE